VSPKRACSPRLPAKRLGNKTYKISRKRKKMTGGGNINDIAILIPISPKGYDMIYRLLNKLKHNNIKIDIFLVFSSQTDYDNFQMKTEIKPILIGNDVDMSNKTGGIVAFKKLYGLNSLVTSKYEYILCCDDELDIIPENLTEKNLKEKITQIFNNKKLYAGAVTPESDMKSRYVIQIQIPSMVLAQKYMESSANLFPSHYEQLKKATNNFTLYFWWSDLPIYKRDTLQDFLETINYKNINYASRYYNYEQIMYGFYLVIKYNFEIIDTTPILNLNYSLEYLDTTDKAALDKLRELKFGFSWMNNIMYATMKDYLLSQKTIFIYSSDRKFIL